MSKKLDKIFDTHKCKQDFGAYGMGIESLEGDLYKYAKAMEAENKKLREGIASIIRDSKNDGSYLIVPIRKLLELNQAPTGGGDR